MTMPWDHTQPGATPQADNQYAVPVPTFPTHAGGRFKRYDVDRNVYNWKPSNTRKLRAALGRARSGLGRADLYCVGDSGTENQVGSAAYDHLRMWPQKLKEALVASGITDGGLSLHLGSNTLAANDPRVVRTSGTWTNNAYSISSPTASATLTIATPGTAIDVAYSNLSGSFTVTTQDVNGGAAVTVTPTGANTTGHYTVTGLPENANRTVTITRTAGTLYVFGVSGYRASGLLVHNMGANGSTAQQWAAVGTGIAEGRIFSLAPGYTAGCVLIMLGANDIATRTRTQIKNDLVSVRNKFSGSDCILLGYPQPNGDSTGLWNTLTAAGYDAADQLDCPFVDLFDRTGGYAVANANGIIGTDSTHANQYFQSDLAGSLASLLRS